MSAQARESTPLLLSPEVGRRESLLGNEAIVRGALEAGVAFVSGYPGTPSSEVTDSFARVGPPHGVVFEYSVNEKVALEMAFAASLAGARSLCAMKHLGLMVAGDPLSTIPYMGVGAGLVIMSAGDPSCRTSPNEQDQRYLGPMLHLVVLDPSTPEEAYAMTRFAFDLSEESRLPVLLRATTRVCHTRGAITFGPLAPRVVRGFERDPARLIPVPVNARRLRLELPGRLARASSRLAGSGFVRVEGDGPHLVIAAGAPAAVTWDLLREQGLGDEVTLMTVGALHPLPEEALLGVLSGAARALVVEELSPFLEDAIRALASLRRLGVEILGKRTGHLPEAFELEPPAIGRALFEAFGLGRGPAERPAAAIVPRRPPTLCPGCPHRAGLFAARAAFAPDQLFFSDIGCYTLGFPEPLGVGDAILCMGAGFTLAAGVSRVTGRRTVGLLGDSTFFHSGMPALLNAIKEDVNMVAVILDNQVTAMTGFQTSPTVTVTPETIGRAASIADVVRALGAKHVETADPYDLGETLGAFTRARDAQGVSVVILERPCPAYLAKQRHTPYQVGTFAVDPDQCQRCGREAVGMRCGTTSSVALQRHGSRQRCLCAGDAAVLAERARARGESVQAAFGARGPDSAPCADACPLGLCVQGLLGHVAARDYAQAYHMIVERIALPDSVCRVCHRPCEAACARRAVDAPVAVNDVKRFVMDWAAAEGLAYDPPREPPSGHRVAVVGAGPAGLTAAHDLALRGHAVTLLDEAASPGGLLRAGIPGYRLPLDALERDVARILGLGVVFRGGVTLGAGVTLSTLLAEGHDAVFLATGAPQGMALGVAGSAPTGQGAAATPRVAVVDALTYLRAAAAGAPLPTPRRVVVVGGGNAAIDAARTARRLGAAEVVIAYRRRQAEMPALVEEVHAALEEGVVIHEQRQPVAMSAEGLLCVATEVGLPDDSGRGRPVPLPGTEHTLPADLVLVAVGQGTRLWDEPTLDPPLAIDPMGRILADPATGQTSHRRIFAGGDVTPGLRNVTWAMAAGRRAAWGIDRMLSGAAQANRRPPPPVPRPAAAVVPLGHPPTVPRGQPPQLPAERRLAEFAEVVGSFTEAEALAEAARCLSCGSCGHCRSCIELLGCPAFFVTDGKVQIDASLCMGCGICAVICPNQAIHPVEPESLSLRSPQESAAKGVSP